MKTRASVLIAEDEKQARESLRALLEDEGYSVVCADNGTDAFRILSTSSVEAALLDIRMPGMDGLSILRDIRTYQDPPAILIMTAYGTSGAAIEAMALGAFDYLTKPLNFDELCIQLQRAIENRRRMHELEAYKAETDSLYESQLIGNSKAMQEVYKLIGQVAPTDLTVLIRGESGTGKEVIARAIHKHSARAHQRMVKVDCTSLPETLLEAELFGYEPGAFTGATHRRIGKLEFAAGGTLFLDEIGELSPSTQTKLLRMLEDQCIERLGSNITIHLDLRVLAATNRDLESTLRDGQFREDLYYRLNVVTITVPSLRERLADIPDLAQYFLRRSAGRTKAAVPTLSEEARSILLEYNWPGNVRELKHCLERALILSRSGVIMPENIKLATEGVVMDPLGSIILEEGLHEAVRKLERSLITKALETSNNNKTRAAELLKINRRLLYDKMREYGLD